MRAWPNRPRGRMISEPVSLRDLPATIASLVGHDKNSPFPGKSLDRFWTESNLVGQSQVGQVLMETDKPLFLTNRGREPVSKGPRSFNRFRARKYRFAAASGLIASTSAASARPSSSKCINACTSSSRGSSSSLHLSYRRSGPGEPGSREVLLPPRPLRTARDSFPSCSSSLHERPSRDAAALVRSSCTWICR